MNEDDPPLPPHRRMKRILNRDRQEIENAAHADILKAAAGEGTTDEKIANMNSLTDIAYRLVKRHLRINKPEK